MILKIGVNRKQLHFYRVRRPNYPQNPRFPMIWVDAPNLDISSSLIRKNVATGNSIRYLVPESVRLYIESRGLYRD